ncbi:MAG: hypothetical protein DSY42_06165, partial [Aquifex sp.]
YDEFDELIKYTFGGFFLGLLAGFILDFLNFTKNFFAEWIVRTLSGEGESIFEGIFAIKKKLENSAFSLAQAYGWGKFIGMSIPWFIDGFSRLLGINVYSWEGFYIPYFYAMSDQIGGTVGVLTFLSKREGSFMKGFIKFVKNPVGLTSLGIILIVPIGLLVVRLLGFSPETNTLVALETIAANLCWLPPLVGLIMQRREKSS